MEIRLVTDYGTQLRLKRVCRSDALRLASFAPRHEESSWVNMIVFQMLDHDSRIAFGNRLGYMMARMPAKPMLGD